MSLPKTPPRGVLVTRPEPGCAETAAAVAVLGWQPVLAPALVLRPRALAAPRVQAMLITSRASAASLPLGPPVFAVGEASAAQARAYGHAHVTAAAGDAAALLALVRARLRPADGPLLLAVGQGYALDLAQDLRDAGFAVHRRLAYAAEPAAALPAEAQMAVYNDLVSQALFLSPRSAACCITQLRDAGLAAKASAVRAIAISPRVAEVLADLPWRGIEVASCPDHDTLLQLLGPHP
jgi:uroporphyrinogen-III synthase